MDVDVSQFVVSDGSGKRIGTLEEVRNGASLYRESEASSMDAMLKANAALVNEAKAHQWEHKQPIGTVGAFVVEARDVLRGQRLLDGEEHVLREAPHSQPTCSRCHGPSSTEKNGRHFCAGCAATISYQQKAGAPIGATLGDGVAERIRIGEKAVRDTYGLAQSRTFTREEVLTVIRALKASWQVHGSEYYDNGAKRAFDDMAATIERME